MTGPSIPPPSITVFFPCYNDGESLRKLVPRAVETLAAITSDFELLVVDDGSRSDTLQVLDSLLLQFPELRIIRHPRNLGYGAALQTGFRSAAKDWVFYTDGDGQYDVRELAKLWALAGESVDAVLGTKARRADPMTRRVIGKLYNALVRFFFNLKFKDVDCDFRLLRRTVLERITLCAPSGAIGVDLMRQIQSGGFRFVETPVNHYPRVHGKSEFFHVLPIARTAGDLVRLWMRWVLPRRRREGPPAALPGGGA